MSETLQDIRTIQNSRAADWLRINAGSHPDRICFATDAASFTFAETNARVNRIATSLRQLGIEKGDRVALFATDSPEYMEIILACMKLGAVYVPLNFRLSRDEITWILADAEPAAILVEDHLTGLVRTRPRGPVN